MKRINKKKTLVEEMNLDNSMHSEQEIGNWNKPFTSKKEKKQKFQYLLKKLQESVSLKEKQLEYSQKIEYNTITFVTGAAGCSKTWTACYTLLKLLFESKIEKIIFTKPVKESGENLGFLPGGIEEKLTPYMESFIYTCKKMIGDQYTDSLIKNGFIENRPLAYMRGITFDKCGMFLDEAQNCLFEQFILYITRLGTDSKIIIAGDITQRDIEKKKVVFLDFIEMIGDLDNVATHKFSREDIVRNSLLIKITERYEDWKDKKEKADKKSA